jgi:hypothetical protein
MSPSLFERMSFRKDLNKVPAAACWDYAEIPLSPDALGQTVGHSRWASVARSVSSNPVREQTRRTRQSSFTRNLLENNEQN